MENNAKDWVLGSPVLRGLEQEEEQGNKTEMEQPMR